jgi:NAD(P)-dependent dehydrogenase (short-subunit alcohol dehydrogenase family)
MHPALTTGRVAIITGSASGIGLAAAKAFASRGMDIVLSDISSELSRAKQSLQAEFPTVKVLAVETDVADLKAVENLRTTVDREFKGREVGVLMLNAGIGGATTMFPREGMELGKLRENFGRILETNLWGVVNGVQTFLPEMVKQKGPSVVICTGSKQVERRPDRADIRESQIPRGIQLIMSPRRG